MTTEQEIQANINDLTTGKISYAEYQRRQYICTKKAFLPQLLEYKTAGKWKEFTELALSSYEVLPEAFSFYDEMPDSLKYDFAVKAYTNHGDSIPAVRKAIQGARKYGKPTLPPELQAQEEITIYRAGEEDIENCKYRISWTTDLERAYFFLNTYQNRHANYLYRAKIKTADIIAYTDARNEKEVMQYCKVFCIEDITEKGGKA